MNQLISNGVVEPYQPLMDIKGSNAAQFEHVSCSRAPKHFPPADLLRRRSSCVKHTKKFSVVETITSEDAVLNLSCCGAFLLS